MLLIYYYYMKKNFLKTKLVVTELHVQQAKFALKKGRIVLFVGQSLYFCLEKSSNLP